MRPTAFPGANRNLTKPQGWEDKACGDLPVYSDGAQCISRWGLNWRERIAALLFGTVWLRVHSGSTQPPVSLQVSEPFVARSRRARLLDWLAPIVVLIALTGPAYAEHEGGERPCVESFDDEVWPAPTPSVVAPPRLTTFTFDGDGAFRGYNQNLPPKVYLAAHIPAREAVEEPASVFEDVPAPPPPQAEGMHLSILAGGLMSMSSEVSAQPEPLGRIAVEGPLALGNLSPENLPRIAVTADLTALPGDTLDVADQSTWRALEFSLVVEKRISRELGAAPDQKISTSLYVEGGFATRLPGDPQPRDKSPRWAGGGVVFRERTGGDHLAVGLTADQRLDGTYQPAVTVRGSVGLWKAKDGAFAGARVALIGNAILGLNWSASYPGLTGARRDVVRVGLAIGR